jgi:hypothetical protein
VIRRTQRIALGRRSANLALVDMLFGTFRNPRNVDGLDVGFYNGASTRIRDMLLFKDVSRPERPVAGVRVPAA